MSEALTDQEREDLLRSVGYTPDVDAPVAFDEMAQATPGETRALAQVLNDPMPKKYKKKNKNAEPTEVTATSPMYDNAWQDQQFQARKAIVGKGYTKEEASEYNKALWKALGAERMEHNRLVRQAQRDLSGTGTLKDVITAQRDHAESVDDLVRSLRELPRDQLDEALKRLP